MKYFAFRRELLFKDGSELGKVSISSSVEVPGGDSAVRTEMERP